MYTDHNNYYDEDSYKSIEMYGYVRPTKDLPWIPRYIADQFPMWQWESGEAETQMRLGNYER